MVLRVADTFEIVQILTCVMLGMSFAVCSLRADAL